MHSEEQATSRVFHACIHPALSGLFGSIASLVGKIENISIHEFHQQSTRFQRILEVGISRLKPSHM